MAMMGLRNYEVSTHIGLRFLWAAVAILDNSTLLVFTTYESWVLFWDLTHKR